MGEDKDEVTANMGDNKDEVTAYMGDNKDEVTANMGDNKDEVLATVMATAEVSKEYIRGNMAEGAGSELAHDITANNVEISANIHKEKGSDGEGKPVKEKVTTKDDEEAAVSERMFIPEDTLAETLVPVYSICEIEKTDKTNEPDQEDVTMAITEVSPNMETDLSTASEKDQGGCGRKEEDRAREEEELAEIRRRKEKLLRARAEVAEEIAAKKVISSCRMLREIQICYSFRWS